MTKKELQAQINFLVSELEHLRTGYNKLSDEAFNNLTQKLRFYVMYQKVDEKAERYGGLLHTLYEASKELDGMITICQLLDDWYEQEVIK